jgi:hypothetical protein
MRRQHVCMSPKKPRMVLARAWLALSRTIADPGHAALLGWRVMSQGMPRPGARATLIFAPQLRAKRQWCQVRCF